MQLLEWPIKHVAVENPVSSRVFEMPEYDQEIQPYQFGHPYTKKRDYGCEISHSLCLQIL